MDRQIDNNTVFISATEPILYSGCDFRLYWAAFGLCFMAAVCLFCILPIPASLYAIGVDVVCFLAARWWLQELAKSDPLTMPVYLRHIKWPAWLPAHGKVLKEPKASGASKKKMTHTHQYEHGVSDLIQATALIEDGIIALKDGGLLAGWRYTGTSNLEAAEVVRDRLAATLDYGKGWVMETNAIRLPSTVYPAWGDFPDPVSRLIEDERIRNYTGLRGGGAEGGAIGPVSANSNLGRYFETQYYLTLSWFPPSRAGEKAKGWFYETPEAQCLASQALDHFRARIADFESLASGFLEMNRLGADGGFDSLLRYIQLCITGEDRLFLKPDLPIDLDFLLGGVDLHGGSKPLIDGRHLRVLAIDPLPQAIYPAMLRALELLPMPFRLNGRAILLDRIEAAELHKANMGRHNSKVVPFLAKVFRIPTDKINPRAAEMAKEANIANSLTEDHNESWGHYSARVVLIRDTEEEISEAIDTIRSCAEASHLKIRVETLNVNDAWCGSLPGHAFFDIRQVPIRAFNIAGMSPLHATWTGHEYHPSPKMPRMSSPLLVATGEGMTTYRHHLHFQDVGHTAVFGPTGNGKTTIFGLHAASLLRYPNAQVVMFDRNRTQYVLCEALGGRFYDFGDKSLELCPLKHLDSPADIAWAGNYIELLCSMNGLTITATHTDRIGKAMERFAKRQNRSLTHFAGSVGDQEIQAALQLYTIGNPVSARLLDGEDDAISDSHFTVFEMAELMQMNRRISMAVQMYLFRRVERKLNPSRVTGIFLDEARRMIGDDLFASTIENWLKEIRNLNGFVMLALQEIEDGNGTKLRSVIEQQCKTKIFLPNPAARMEHTSKAYNSIGLTQSQIQQVINARAKREYFVSTPEHWTKLTFDIEQVALAFLSSNTPNDRALVDRLIADNPEFWQVDFLRSRGLHDWAEHLNYLKGRA